MEPVGEATYTVFYCPVCKPSNDPKCYDSVKAAEHAAVQHVQETKDTQHIELEIHPLDIRIGECERCAPLVEKTVTVKVCKHCDREKK